MFHISKRMNDWINNIETHSEHDLPSFYLSDKLNFLFTIKIMFIIIVGDIKIRKIEVNCCGNIHSKQNERYETL